MRINSKIRFALPSDVPQLIELCRLHATYEKAGYEKNGKARRLKNDLFNEYPKMYCLVVESNNVLVGYATYMAQYATWDAREYIYMDCLFIKEFARGMGLGEKLVRKIEIEGKKLDCSSIQWQTPDFNTRAIKFYKRIGANSKSKERFFLNF